MESSSNNLNLNKFEKNLKNRINRKYAKLFQLVKDNKLHFDNLPDEIKFLNQLYFLHQSVKELEDNIDNTLEIINNVRNQENIKLDFKKKISDDNWNNEIINNLSSLVFLSS